MTTTSIKVIKDVHSFLLELFDKKLSSKFVYHNEKHTKHVVENVTILIKYHSLSEEEEQIVLLSAWLHCTGYTISATRAKQHSAEIARKYLYAYGYEMDFVDQVQNTILSLQYPRKPQNILEKILCDATLRNLSTIDFWKRSLDLRKEWELNCFAIYDTLSWSKNTLDFLDKHVYFSEYAQKNWKTQNNKELLEQKILTFD